MRVVDMKMQLGVYTELTELTVAEISFRQKLAFALSAFL